MIARRSPEQHSRGRAATTPFARVHGVSGLDGMEIVEGVYPAFRFPRHAHPHFTFSVLTAGEQCFEHRGGTTLVRSGDAVLLNPDEAHANAPASQSWSHVSLCFSEANLTDFAPEFRGQKIAIGSTFICDGAVSQRLAYLPRFADGTREFELQELALQLIDTVFRKHSGMARPFSVPVSIDKVRERLLDAPEINVSLLELSCIAGISPTALLRSFTRTFGCTPHTFQTARRIDRSKQLLRTGFEIADAAAMTGFVDQSHFTHTFKKWLGITPARYRIQTSHANPHQTTSRRSLRARAGPPFR
jgi:AraC-like DNA-binding protein/quercetin dioxygenase-like cupin family protein